MAPKLGDAGVLALAAGAERNGEHPIAHAITRAARTRGVRPDGVRNPNVVPGLGVTAVTSAGEELCVGNRSLMLEQRISIAGAEQRIGELEALGRTVVLVAVGARLVGMLGLQDGLRPGARAAVQHLLDAQSGAGARLRRCARDVRGHRPLAGHRSHPSGGAAGGARRRGAPPHRRRRQRGRPRARRHRRRGARAPPTCRWRSAAAGSTPGDFAVALASDDVRDAALSLALAHRTRTEAKVAVALAVVPALFGSVAAAFGILPPAYAPIASLLGGAMAVAHSRALERTTTPG